MAKSSTADGRREAHPVAFPPTLWPTVESLPFEEIWAVDFEYHAPPGERPSPLCLVALELRSGRKIRLWCDQFGKLPPYRTDAGVLFVAYLASAELGCHAVLDWAMPARVLDLYAEFRADTNGIVKPGEGRASLLGALRYHGLDGIGALEKQEMRDLAKRGGDYTEAEKIALLDYCESDVAALARLLPKMLPTVALPQAMLRGRYPPAIARMQANGPPLDMATLRLYAAHWDDFKDELIKRLDRGFGVYDGRTFKSDRFEAYLQRKGIDWPRHDGGDLDLRAQTFRDAAKVWPEVEALGDLRRLVSGLRLTDLAVGADGRNRVMLSPFQSRTGRNQPSNAKFIFGHSVWMRRLIKPAPGWSVAYVDWEQQEFGIGAALSGDPVKMAAYQSGDPYFAFAQLAGAIPRDAISTDRAHKAVRDRFKTCVLGIDYGMELHTLALRIGQPPIYARDMIEAYRETFSVFWAWADRVVGHAQLRGYLTTVKGWPLYLPRADQLGSRDKPITPRSLRNFPMQANGAEMLRLACCLATERGIPVCAPVHDAVMLYAPTPEIGRHVAAMQAAMAEASREILNGFELRTEAKTFDYPRRYDGDSRGDTMWNTVNALAAELEHSAA